MSGQRHLQRLDVVWQRQPLYFITACVAKRRPVLASPTTHEVLHREWASWRERHGWAVGRYVIMPDHVHFFTMPLLDAPNSLSRVVGAWKEWTTKGISQRLGVVAPLWQPEFFDHLLRNRESYHDKWMYVRENPVRAGLVGEADEWPYGGRVDFQ